MYFCVHGENIRTDHVRLAYRKKPSQAPLCIIDIPADRTRLPENTPEVRNGPSAYTPEMGGRPTVTPEVRRRPSIGTPEVRSRPSIGTPEVRSRPSIGTPEVRSRPSIGTPEARRRPSIGTPEVRSTHFVNPRQEGRRPSPNSYKMGRASANTKEDDETNEYCCINEDLVELQTDFVDPRVSVARKQNDAYEMLTRPQNEYLTLTA